MPITYQYRIPELFRSGYVWGNDLRTQRGRGEDLRPALARPLLPRAFFLKSSICAGVKISAIEVRNASLLVSHCWRMPRRTSPNCSRCVWNKAFSRSVCSSLRSSEAPKWRSVLPGERLSLLTSGRAGGCPGTRQRAKWKPLGGSRPGPDNLASSRTPTPNPIKNTRITNRLTPSCA